MSHWTGLYPKAKVHDEATPIRKGGEVYRDRTLCNLRIDLGWVETVAPVTCKLCLKRSLMEVRVTTRSSVSATVGPERP